MTRRNLTLDPAATALPDPAGADGARVAEPRLGHGVQRAPASVDTVRSGGRAAADGERIARAALTRLGEPDDVGMRLALSRVGAAEPLWRLIRSGGVLDSAWGPLRARLKDADPEADLTRFARLGGRFVIPGDVEWPAALDDLDQPPLGLWIRGRPLDDLTRRAVSVVGARAATAYGTHVAFDLGAGLVEEGWTVVSGGAFGIDAAAHRGALGAGDATLAVLANGADSPYPRGNASLLDQVAERGAVVSEWPPGSVPFRHRFLVRNRVIAALGRGTVVVEAALRSGALRTVADAVRLNRHVMAIPGPVTGSMSQGCLDLLVRGEALLVRGHRDVLDLVAPLGERLDLPAGGVPTSAAYDRLDRVGRRVFDACSPWIGRTVAELAVGAALAREEVEAVLVTLEDEGIVAFGNDGWRRCGTPNGPGSVWPG